MTSLTLLKKAIHNTFAPLLGVDGRVIWADQSEHRPTLPYATLRILSGPIKYGMDSSTLREEAEDDEVDPPVWLADVEGQREIVLSVNVIGPDAIQKIANFQSELEKFSTCDKLYIAGKALGVKGCAIFSNSPAQNLTEIQGSRYVERAQLDVGLRYVSTDTEELGIIESVSITGEYSHYEGEAVEGIIEDVFEDIEIEENP